MPNTNIPEKEEYIIVQSIKFTFGDINTVVNEFYAKVAIDNHLHGPFSSYSPTFSLARSNILTLSSFFSSPKAFVF